MLKESWSEVITNSSNKIHQTWCTHFSRSLQTFICLSGAAHPSVYHSQAVSGVQSISHFSISMSLLSPPHAISLLPRNGNFALVLSCKCHPSHMHISVLRGAPPLGTWRGWKKMIQLTYVILRINERELISVEKV